MAWYDFLTGTPARNEQIQRFNPQQQSALSQILGQGLQGVQPQNFGSQFDPIAKQARSQFSQQTIPGLAERFTSMGSGSALSSPAFASQLGQAGAGLEEGLASQKAGFGLQHQGLLQNLLGMGLTPQFETLHHTAQPGALQQIAGPALQLLMAYMTGGASAALPAAAGMAMGGMGGTGNMGGGQSNISQGMGGTPVYSGQGFANPALYSSGLQSLMRPF